MSIRLLISGLMLTVFVLLLVACSGDDNNEQSAATAVNDASQKAQGAESQLCSSIAALNTSLTQMKNLNSSSTVDQAKQAGDNVKKSMDSVKSDAQNVAGARVDVLNSAYTAFQTVLNNISGSQSLGSAATAIQVGAGTVQSAANNVSSSLNCP